MERNSECFSTGVYRRPQWEIMVAGTRVLIGAVKARIREQVTLSVYVQSMYDKKCTNIQATHASSIRFLFITLIFVFFRPLTLHPSVSFPHRYRRLYLIQSLFGLRRAIAHYIPLFLLFLAITFTHFICFRSSPGRLGRPLFRQTLPHKSKTHTLTHSIPTSTHPTKRKNVPQTYIEINF